MCPVDPGPPDRLQSERGTLSQTGPALHRLVQQVSNTICLVVLRLR